MSFPGKLIDTSAGRVFVHSSGKEGAPPLVLIHGMYVSHYYFKPVLTQLAERFSVTAIDLIGFGESDRPAPEKFAYDAAAQADIVDEVMGALGIASAAVVGHSMGGGVAVALAARHPARVSRLLVENGWVYPIVMPFSGRLALLPGLGGFIFKKLFSRGDLARHFRDVFKDPALATPEMIDYYWERFNRAGARAAGHAALKAFAATPDNTADPGRVKCPTLILWGEEDKLFPMAHAKRLGKQIAGAKVEVVPAAKHSPHEERPEEFLRAAIPFLEGRDVQAAAPAAVA